MNKLTVDDIRKEFKRLKDNNEFTIFKGNVKTVEIVNADFEISENDTAIFGEVNEYADRELAWYESMSLNVNDIPGACPSIWKKCATKDGWINSNYGWCVFHPSNGNQYKNCLKQLIEDNSTRRACMIYTRPTMQYDWCEDNKTDFMCTYATQQFIRDNKLIYIVLMRSNDAVFGFKNDLYWHRYVANKLIEDLHYNHVNVDDKPIIYWHADSLHVYENQFKLIDEYFS